jgi:hypothetical protein
MKLIRAGRNGWGQAARSPCLPCANSDPLWVGLGLALLMSACATTPTPAVKPVESKPIVDFPSPAALEAIASKPAPPPAIPKGEGRSRDWTVDGTQSSASYGERWQPVSSWDNAFAAGVSKAGRDVRLTRAMSCVAREFGRFHLETQAVPPEDMKRFIAGACGAVSPRVGFLSLVGEASPKTSDEALLGRWAGQLKPALITSLPADVSETGFWFGHRGKQAVAMVAYGMLEAELLPFSLVPDSKGEITVEGESRQPADSFVGYANRGEVGVVPCLVDPSLHRPRFRFICHIESTDETAWIDLLYAPPNRVVAKPFARVLARRAPGQAISYHAGSGAIPRPIAREEEFAPSVLGELNRIRQQAGLPPVRLAEAESMTAARMAKHYFVADGADGHPEDADTIARGMLAGWQVQDGMIRDGSFVSSILPESNDALLWLSIALSMPLARETLLDRDVEEVAFGPALLAQPPALGAITSGYRFYHGNDHAQDVRRLFQRVAAARERLSLPPPRRLAEVKEEMLDQLARVFEGSAQPMDALNVVLKRGTTQYVANMKGYAAELTSLEALEIPDEVLKLKKLDLEIGVTHHKPKGAAWGQLVVLVAFIDYGEGQK